MSFSYKKFISNIEEKGLTLNQLKLKGELTGYAYERMITDEPVGIDKIADLCRYLNVPIDYVLDNKYEDKRSIDVEPSEINKSDDLCHNLNVLINYVVEIKYEQESDDQTNLHD